MTVLRRRGHLATKVNIPFFVGNEVLNIFHLTIFSKMAVFSEETAKNRSGGAFDRFSGQGGFYGKKFI